MLARLSESATRHIVRLLLDHVDENDYRLEGLIALFAPPTVVRRSVGTTRHGEDGEAVTDGSADTDIAVVRQRMADAVAPLRAMAYEHRLHILVILMDGESTPDSLATAMSLDGTVIAHHLRSLRDSSLVRRRRRGRNVYYALADDAARRLVTEVMAYAAR